MVALENLKKHKRFQGRGAFLKIYPVLDGITPTLSRLSAKQLHFAVKQWTGGEDYEAFLHAADLGDYLSTDYLMVGAHINPEAVVGMFFQEPALSSSAPSLVRISFMTMFANDPNAALRLAETGDVPEQFRETCELWKDTIATFREPSADNVKRLLAHKTDDRRLATVELVKKLPTQEARIAFFKQLSVTTGGAFGRINDLITPLADRLSFAQMAHLADSVPNIKPPEQLSAIPREPVVPYDLRQAVAAACRDAPVEQRWKWLIQGGDETGNPSREVVESLTTDRFDKDDDTPLDLIVERWCANNFDETANWARNLPPGKIRTAAYGTIKWFVHNSERPDLKSEWEKP